MSRKTIFNLMGILVLLAVLLSACAPAATATPATPPPAATEPPAVTEAPATEAATQAATEAATQPDNLSGKVTIWMWKAPHDALTNSGVLDEFKKIHPNVEVEIVEQHAAGPCLRPTPKT